jgi:hypothetical protein
MYHALAQLQLSLLASFKKEFEETKAGKVAALQVLAKEICETKFQSPLSQWAYADSALVAKKMALTTDLVARLDTLVDDRQTELDDDLAREKVYAKLFICLAI